MNTENPTQLAEVVEGLHVITGPNGMCMCGTEGQTCLQILSRLSPEIRDSALLISLGFKAMPLPDPEPLPMPRGLLRE